MQTPHASALSVTTVSWMFGDAIIAPAAERNPFRWSSAATVPRVIDRLRNEKRPVILKFSERQCSFENPHNAAAAFKEGIKYSGNFVVNENLRMVLTMPETTMHFASAAAAIKYLQGIEHFDSAEPVVIEDRSLGDNKCRVVEETNARFKGMSPDILVFKGGGTRGIVYIGALEKLVKEDLYGKVRKFAGTSAGAQFAAFCAFGFEPQEMMELLREAPWHNLLDATPWYECGCFSNPYRLFKKYGVCPGFTLEGYLEKAFAEKTGIKKCTFKQLYEWREEKSGKQIELKLGAINMTTRKFEYLDRHTHPDMPVSKACRASSAIPAVFMPVKEGDTLFVDGGIEGNLPVKAFGDDLTKQTLAFNLVSKDKGPMDGQFNKFKNFAAEIFEMMLDAAQGYHGVDPHQEISWDLQKRGVDVININFGDHGVLETKMDDARFADLVQRGQKAVERYIDQHPGYGGSD